MDDQKKSSSSEPHVRIFGEPLNSENKVNSSGYHRCGGKDSGNIFWGLIIIFGGILLLLNNIGIASWEIWNYIWPFWPVLLIILGIRIVFGRGWLSGLFTFLFILVSLVTIVIYGLIQVGSPIVAGLSPQITDFMSNFNLFNK